MKILLGSIPIVLTAAFLASSSVEGQMPASRPALSIGYVSAKRVFDESTGGKAEAARVQEMQQQKASELRTKQLALEATRQQLAQAGEPAARVPLQQQEQQQRTDLERSTMQAQTDVQALQRQIQIEFLGRVKPVLQELAKGQNIQLVLNADNAILWAAPGADLTAVVVERLNANVAASIPKP